MAKSNKIHYRLYFRIFYLLLFFMVSCSDKSVDVEQFSDGDVIDSHIITIYSTAEITQILTTLQIPNTFQLKYDVKTVSVEYLSTDINGNEINVSGALLIPQTDISSPMLSIQHGTETKSDLVASVNPLSSVEGITGLTTASMGYLTCVPDYPGFGISKTVHPYLHAHSLSKCVIDFLRASRNFCEDERISINDHLYLLGYSEGGFVTLATHQEIQTNFSDEFTVMASAPMAGPYDLKGTTDFLFEQPSYNYPAYIAFFIYAYEVLYDWNSMNVIFHTPYQSLIPNLFDGSKTFTDINNQLPTQINSLVRQDFIENYLGGNEEKFQDALVENSPLNWVPDAPVHFFHGDQDDVSPYQNSLTAASTLISNGAAGIRLTTIPGGTHATASLPSVVGAISWIDSLYTESEKSANYVSFE